MTPFLKQVKSQGWKLYEIGKIRGLKKTRMAEISKAPTQWDWLALTGLGHKYSKQFRGHAIVQVEAELVYCDTGEPTAGSDRPCGKCGGAATNEGQESYDACLGKLPGVMNACCGHGCESEAYVQLSDRSIIEGPEATVAIEHLRRLGDKREEEG